MPTCQGKTKAGTQCTRNAKDGEQYCWQHALDNSMDRLVDDDGKPRLEVYKLLANATPEEKTDIVLKLIEGNPEGKLELPERVGINADLSKVDLSADTLKARVCRLENEPLWWNISPQDAKLRGANPQEIKRMMRRHRGHPEGPNLIGANLQSTNLWLANLQGTLLWFANLQHARLVSANLQRADLGNANLQHADLHDANLQNTRLWGTDLKDSTLLFANLQGAGLIEANLQGVDLGEADLQGASLMNVNLEGATLSHTNLQDAKLTNVNLKDAHLWGTNLQNARLTNVNLKGAQLWFANFFNTQLSDTNLQGAELTNTKLQQVDLLDCTIIHIFIQGAWLDRTRLQYEQLGGAIGEELDAKNRRLTAQERAEKYSTAKYAYLALKQNFDDLGDYEASSWAYIKERKMEKLEAREKVKVSLADRKWQDLASNGTKFLGDQLIEIVSYYGEGFWHVVGWIASFIFIIGPALFWLFGAFEWTESSKDYYFSQQFRWHQHVYTYYQLLLYTIDTFTTANFAELKPVNAFARLISGCLAIYLLPISPQRK